MGLVLERISSGWSEAADRVRPSLVHVLSHGRGAGAGTIWHALGLIVTNAHVAGAGRLTVRCLGGAEYPATVLACDHRLDLAALAIEAEDLPAIELGASRQLRSGQLVLAMGHPWGIAYAATLGSVIEVGKSLAALPKAEGEWIAVSLHLRPGHSGGALIDMHGRLVGINTLMAGPDVGMAIPVEVAKRFMQQALARRSASRTRLAA
jgi:S1-C subfamily serine protease